MQRAAGRESQTGAKAEKPAKDKKLSAIDAAAKLLVETGEPMNCKAMIEQIAAKGYWTSPGGKTPHATLYSAIIREINFDLFRRAYGDQLLGFKLNVKSVGAWLHVKTQSRRNGTFVSLRKHPGALRLTTVYWTGLRHGHLVLAWVSAVARCAGSQLIAAVFVGCPRGPNLLFGVRKSNEHTWHRLAIGKGHGPRDSGEAAATAGKTTENPQDRQHACDPAHASSSKEIRSY